MRFPYETGRPHSFLVARSYLEQQPPFFQYVLPFDFIEHRIGHTVVPELNWVIDGLAKYFVLYENRMQSAGVCIDKWVDLLTRVDRHDFWRSDRTFGAPRTFSLFDVGQIDLHSDLLQVQTGIPHVRISSPLVLRYKFLGYVMLFFLKFCRYKL